jgi:TRAP-type mannitol/chloroaromatic compound transport system permease small subunit
MDLLLKTVADKINIFIDFIGRTVAWLGLVMVFTTLIIVVLRYGFNLGWIWLQESVLYCHAILFMLGCSYALQHDEHVRVDIFYRRFSAQKKALVNILGHLILVWPVCIFILLVSADYVAISWQIKEASQEAGGIPLVYLLKTLIPVLSVTLLLQSLALLLSNFVVLTQTSVENS